jgi:hypothetical protein
MFSDDSKIGPFKEIFIFKGIVKANQQNQSCSGYTSLADRAL